MARELVSIVVVVAPLREIIAVRQRRERAFEGQNMQAVARQIEIANDLGSQQAHDIREHRKPEPRKDLFTDRCAADDFALFEYEHASAGSCEVSRAHETVVSAADDDGIVAGAHARLRGGSKNGFFTTRAAARLR